MIWVTKDPRMGECVVALLGIVVESCGAEDVVGLVDKPFELGGWNDKYRLS